MIDNELLLEPNGTSANYQGWIAPGATVEAFKSIPEAYSNRLKYLHRPERSVNVAVVLNDESMLFELSEVVKAYRENPNGVSINLEVVKQLTRHELATLFEKPFDLVHFIGHCNSGGLQCSDGTLSTQELSVSNTQSFFLNACGSFQEGLELVRRGSVAGAVTIGDVLDSQAIRVGTTLARLIMQGYGFEHALSLARRRSIMNRMYAVVGDGLHTITSGFKSIPSVVYAQAISEAEYQVQIDTFSPQIHGGILTPWTIGKPVLTGNDEIHTVDKEEFKEHLQFTNDPIIFDDKFYWPEELLEELF